MPTLKKIFDKVIFYIFFQISSGCRVRATGAAASVAMASRRCVAPAPSASRSGGVPSNIISELMFQMGIYIYSIHTYIYRRGNILYFVVVHDSWIHRYHTGYNLFQGSKYLTNLIYKR